jgi:hypothetical protein
VALRRTSPRYTSDWNGCCEFNAGPDGFDVTRGGEVFSASRSGSRSQSHRSIGVVRGTYESYTAVQPPALRDEGSKE